MVTRVLVVGHQPLIGWLAHELTGNATPVGRGEMLCIRMRGKRGRLYWALSPSDPAADQELKEKIRSKIDVAKVLIGFITAALGFLLGGLAAKDSPPLAQGLSRISVYVGAGFLLIGVMLYLAALYSYDSLLLPNRFWSESAKNMRRPRWVVKRPPSSSMWVRYQNMVRIWNWLFTPGTWFTLAGLLALAYAVLRPIDCWKSWFDGIYAAVAVVAVAACAIARFTRLAHRYTGPWLGSED